MKTNFWNLIYIIYEPNIDTEILTKPKHTYTINVQVNLRYSLLDRKFKKAI